MNSTAFDIHHDHMLTRVHKQAKDVVNHLDQRRFCLDECEHVPDVYYDDLGYPYYRTELDWRYVEEKSKIGDALAPAAIIRRSDGLELRIAYECRYDAMGRFMRDGLCVAYLIPSDSRGVRVDQDSSSSIDWNLRVWLRIDEDPEQIADVINRSMLAEAERLRWEAIQIIGYNEQYYASCETVVGAFAGLEGAREVDPINDDKRVLELLSMPGPSLEPVPTGVVSVTSWDNPTSVNPWGEVTVTVTLPLKKAREVVEVALGRSKEDNVAHIQVGEQEIIPSRLAS